MLKFYIPSDPYFWLLANDKNEGKICAKESFLYTKEVCKKEEIEVDIQVTDKLTIPSWDNEDEYTNLLRVSLLFFNAPVDIALPKLNLYRAELEEIARQAHIARQKDITENTIKYLSVPTVKAIPKEEKKVKNKKKPALRTPPVRKKTTAPMFVPTFATK